MTTQSKLSANSSINELGLTTRAINALMVSNILKIQDLIEHSEKELLTFFPGLGEKSVKDIKETLARHGLYLAHSNNNTASETVKATKTSDCAQATGGPANPVFIVAGNANPRELAQQLESMQTGLTLRDYFAAQAMQAIITASTALADDHPESFDSATVFGFGEAIGCTDENGKELTYASNIASNAYYMADAMLRARQQPTATE